MIEPTNSDRALFAQGGGGPNGKKKEPFDEACWKGKTCHKCNGKDPPASHCPKKSRKSEKAEKTDDDDNAASTAHSVSKLKKDFKKMLKAFTTVEAKLNQLKESKSGLSGLDAEEEASHFQRDEAFQFTQLESSGTIRAIL